MWTHGKVMVRTRWGKPLIHELRETIVFDKQSLPGVCGSNIDVQFDNAQAQPGCSLPTVLLFPGRSHAFTARHLGSAVHLSSSDSGRKLCTSGSE